jgi:hypothetical protein
MVALQDLRSLAARKQELLLASDIQRQSLQLEWGMIQLRLSQLKRISVRLPALWMVAVPLAGFLMARKLRRATGLLAKGGVLVVALFKVLRLVRRIRSALT